MTIGLKKLREATISSTKWLSDIYQSLLTFKEGKKDDGTSHAARRYMEKTVAEIERLSKLLEMRDKFIVDSGLWMKFTESLESSNNRPNHPRGFDQDRGATRKDEHDRA